jgi:hypothetical protein
MTPLETLAKGVKNLEIHARMSEKYSLFHYKKLRWL